MAANVHISTKKLSFSMVKFSKPLSESEVIINFDPSRFNRRSNQSLEEAIDKIWQEKVAKNSHLYNGSKFRQAGYRMKDGKLEIDVGLTSYKDLVGTNLQTDVDVLMKDGLKTHGDVNAYLSHPLAVGIMLLTSDDHVIALERSHWTGECAGMFDRPGGHPEPSEVKSLKKFLNKGDDSPSQEDINLAVKRELWSSIVREVMDEVGIPNPIEVFLTGFTHSTDIGGRPTVDFIGRLPLTKSEVEKLYSKGEHSEAEESTGIWCISPEEVKAILRAISKLFNSTEEKTSKMASPGKEEEGDERIEKLVKDNFAPALIASLLLASDMMQCV